MRQRNKPRNVNVWMIGIKDITDGTETSKVYLVTVPAGSNAKAIKLVGEAFGLSQEQAHNARITLWVNINCPYSHVDWEAMPPAIQGIVQAGLTTPPPVCQPELKATLTQGVISKFYTTKPVPKTAKPRPRPFIRNKQKEEPEPTPAPVTVARSRVRKEPETAVAPAAPVIEYKRTRTRVEIAQ